MFAGAAGEKRSRRSHALHQTMTESDFVEQHASLAVADLDTLRSGQYCNLTASYGRDPGSYQGSSHI